MNRVSIVILNWNGKHYLQQFLGTLNRFSRLEGVEIVVADNGSTDGSEVFLASEFPQVKFLALDRNYGFTGGYNRALSQIDAEYYLLLNSDVEVTEGWLEPLIEHMDSRPDCAVCMPKILDHRRPGWFEYAGAAGGYIARFGYPFCRGRIFDSLEEDRVQYDEPAEIFWATGACMMVRAGLYRQAGGLDEHFFAHMEEIDLCWRLKRMGYRNHCIPSSRVYHVGGGTLPYGDPKKTYFNFRNNLLLLYKNLPSGSRGRTILIRLLLDGISALRFLLRGSFGEFRALLRAHRDFSGMKKVYKGTENKEDPNRNAVLVPCIYPGSIVSAFFLGRKRTFSELGWKDSIETRK